MEKIKLSGSHYEIGLQLGSILKNELGKGYPPAYAEEVLEKSRAYEEQVRIFAPDLLDEFRGIADSLDIDYFIPVTLEASPHRFETTSCLVMAISGEHTSSGFPLLARNNEWKEEDSKNLRICYTQPEGKLHSLGFTFSWPLVSRYGGMNEAGLALSSASASFENTGPGIMLNIATRWILDTCTTTKEAVAYLEKMPKVWGETYIVMDKNNNLAKVESHRNKTKVTFSTTGFESTTLLYDSPEMQDYLSPAWIDRCSSIVSTRKAFLNQWFAQNKGEITKNMVIDVLKDHNHQVCDHALEGLEICWSYILDMVENNALLCAGRPCRNEYIRIEGA